MKVNRITLVLVIVVCSSLGAKLPSDYKICRRDDPKIADCLKDAVQIALRKLENGIPELKIAKLQPLYIPSASIGGGENGPVNLKQEFKDMMVYGLSSSIVQGANVSFTDKNVEMDLDVTLAELEFKADYILDGSVLLLPIVGDGKCTVTATDAAMKLHLTSEQFQKKGVDYLRVSDCKVDIAPTKVAFNFENLFNGDEALGKQTNAILNDNWNEIFKTAKDGYEQVVCAVVGNYANNVFSKISLDELFPN